MFNGVLWVSDCMTGKMSGIQSISTSVLDNPICQARRKIKGSICEKCFACATLNRYSDLQTHLHDNFLLMNNSVIDWDDLPRFRNANIVRFESFGDSASVNHVINTFNICRKNPNVQFTIWTKNPNFIVQALKQGYTKPENLIIVLSSAKLNEVETMVYKFVDIVFTVFTAEYAIEHDITINCGSRDCLGCMKCYTKHDGIVYVNEMLKSQQKKYEKLLEAKKGTR